MSKVTRRLRSNGADWTETCRKGKNARGAVKAGQDRVFSKIRGKSVEGDPTKGTETIIPILFIQVQKMPVQFSDYHLVACPSQ